MALSVKSILMVAATAMLTVSLGLYSLSGRVVGQESRPEATITIDAAADPFGDRSVRVVATEEAKSETDPESAPGAAHRSRQVRGCEPLREFPLRSRKTCMLEFNEAPLSEVVDYLKTANNIPIVIDLQGAR